LGGFYGLKGFISDLNLGFSILLNPKLIEPKFINNPTSRLKASR
jgi:hypothetical protein